MDWSNTRKSPSCTVFTLTCLLWVSASPRLMAVPSLVASAPAAVTPEPIRLAQARSFVDDLLPTAPTVTARTAEPQPAAVSPSPAAPAVPPVLPGETQRLPQGAEDYTLGPGDRVFVDIFNVPEYSKSYLILPDGTLNLPRIGQIPVTGLTLQALGDIVTAKYSRFFRQPLTTIVLEQARPLRVAISGEVNRPGTYKFEAAAGGGVPLVTITELIQQSGGITQRADLRQIEVRRPLLNDLEQVISVNLWELLQSSNLNQDISLRDGDMIRVPTAPSLSPAQLSQVATASFAPQTIRVNVVGEVVKPGVLEVLPNTSLNQALLAAGGFHSTRANRQTVELIRLQPNGTIARRTVPVDLAADINEATNPIVQPNDVIIVDRSSFTRTTDTITQVTAPLFLLLNNLLRFF
ncbi:SLBB domain-containing protein [Trichothermofontia sichuanensis B231]|uniref:SLBB domain-containing protein n=1 Tax=Trichothermofontia sichuanensis TaxID=3045816 RepID=UPI002247D7AE|nr:SLBB domain-containing protein [Trichothermofontia sichuanensis]UZQ55470.1 SLBB domain-containing protein [Trichothermofontia sichuanensis B231]